jgi:hypothetical protein
MPWNPAKVDYKAKRPCRRCGREVSVYIAWKHERWCFTPQTLDRLLEIGGLTEFAARHPTECWLWHNGVRTKKERPRLHGRYVYVIAWELIHGSVPEGLVVCHTCDDGWCLNPTHLWVGTIADNNRDMFTKGRNRKGRSGQNLRERTYEDRVAAWETRRRNQARDKEK